MTQLGSTDRKLLNLVQMEFPLTREPFADLGQRLGTGGNEVIKRIEKLKERKKPNPPPRP